MRSECRYKYEMVADLIREDIREGVYSNGEVPDEAVLMKQFKVGKITVYNALKLLAEEGIISRIQGKGTFINGVFGRSLTVSGQVAVIMSHIGHYYSSLARQIRDNLNQHSLFSIPVDELSEVRSFAGGSNQLADRLFLLLNSNIHGAIYDGNGYHEFPFMDKYLHMRSVVVNFFDAPGEIPGSGVLIDFGRGVSKAVKYSAEKGHHRILFLTHRPSNFPPDDPVHAMRHPVQQMKEGYLRTMEESGLSSFCEIIIRRTDTMDDLIRGILSRPDRPETILCGADVDALKIIMTAFTMGIRVPEELSVIGMYNTPWAEESPIKMTSISFCEDRIAEEAVNLIAAETWEKKIITIEPELIIRRSA